MKPEKTMDKFKNPLQKLFAGEKKKVVANLFTVLVVGVLLLVLAQTMLRPEEAGKPRSLPQHQPTETESKQTGVSLEARLEEILSLVEGAGTVRVMIHEARGQETVFAREQTLDESKTKELDSSGGSREQSQVRTNNLMVTLNRREGGDEPLVLYENAPKIEGVIIVAEGGGDIIVRDALIRAASGLLGVAVHKVTVLQMAANK
ncbi:MAG: hypothetical protein FWE91_13290 [Defluviitaleaceae bacterium]|nr:hypothetical protein [Defluviitaleaceae bacterium]